MVYGKNTFWHLTVGWLAISRKILMRGHELTGAMYRVWNNYRRFENAIIII